MHRFQVGTLICPVSVAAVPQGTARILPGQRACAAGYHARRTNAADARGRRVANVLFGKNKPYWQRNC